MDNAQESQTTNVKSIWSSLISGFAQLFVNWRVLIWWWLGNLLAAALIIAPLASTMQEYFGQSLAGRVLPTKFNVQSLFEFYSANPDLPEMLLTTMVLILGLYMAASLLFLGGSIHFFKAQKEGAPKRNFGLLCKESMRLFPRLIRLLLLSFVFYGLFFMLYKYVGRWLGGFVKGSLTEAPVALVARTKLIFLFSGLAMLKIFFDVVKIRMIVEDQKSAVKTTWRCLRMCSFRLSRFVFIFLLTTLIVWLITPLYSMSLDNFNDTVFHDLFWIFLVHQGFLLLRIAVKLWFYSASVHWYESTRPSPDDDEGADPAPEENWELGSEAENDGFYFAPHPHAANPKAAESAAKHNESQKKSIG